MPSPLALGLVMIFIVGLGAACNRGESDTVDASRRSDEAATVVVQTIATTLGEWEAAATDALAGRPTAPDGVSIVVLESSGDWRATGLPLPFLPSVAEAERPARDALTPAERAGAPTAEVIADSWKAWQKSGSGRAAEARGQTGVAAVWQSRDGGMAVVAGPIALLMRAAAAKLDDLKVRAGIEEPNRAGATPSSTTSRVRSLEPAGLSWVVRVTPR